MQHPVTDFLGAALIPVLCPDIAAGTPCHIHLVLIAVLTVRALPDKLSVLFDNPDFAVITA